jgi:WD40 repeat protein
MKSSATPVAHNPSLCGRRLAVTLSHRIPPMIVILWRYNRDICMLLPSGADVPEYAHKVTAAVCRQIITGSHDKTIKMWDLRKGKTMSTLTYHKKSIRSMAAHPQEYSFAAGSADNIKKYRLPQVPLLLRHLCTQAGNPLRDISIRCSRYRFVS